MSKFKQITRNPKRGSRAHSLVEVSLLSVLFVVIAILCLDVGYVMMASQLNDRACRDAARAAAEADNYLSSLQMAQAAVIPHKGDGYWVTNPKVATSKFVYQDFSGSPPTNVSPYVTVTTDCDVRIPAPIFFLGASFKANGIMSFTKTYTFPIVKTTLYLN